MLLIDYLFFDNSFYYDLLSQYADDQAELDAFIEQNRGETVDRDDIPDDLFSTETYPVAGNTPRTLNILKREFMLLQSEEEREPWHPHEPGDGSATWPSESEQEENYWTSWDFARIDHFMASRPFGKWFVLAEDPEDDYLGVLDDTGFANNGVPLSDHAPLAHNVKWVGPELERFDQAGETETRLIWGRGAPVFDDNDGVFYLTRNNQREDVYLGQIADEWGNPILTDLTLEEKRTRLDCGSSDPRFQQAIADYCIDDHSFISETLVTDGGTLVVDEDAALGDSDAALRLNDGGLRIAGTQMVSLDREVRLEGDGGFIEVVDGRNEVSLARQVSGSGAFEKRGQGTLVLEGDHAYTGETRVSGGLLAVDGSIVASSHTRVADGAVLGGNGRVGDLTIESGGALSPGRSIGTLNVEGDLRFEQGAIYQAEVDSDGNSDRVEVSGEVLIDGGSVLALAANGRYAPATEYRLLMAQEGVSGEFDAVSSSLAFLDPSLRYGEQDVTLRMERNDMAFQAVAMSPNRRAAARGVESLGVGNGLYDAVVTLDGETANAAFGQVSGELHAGLQGAMVDESRLLRHAVMSRLSGTGDSQQVLATGGDTGLTTWWQGIGNWGRSDAGEGRDLTRDTTGFLIGADGDVGEAGRLGIVAGYGATSYDGDGMLGTADADSYHLGIYGGARLGSVELSLGASHSRSSVDTEREVAFPNVRETLTAEYDGGTTQVFGETRYPLSFGRMSLEPFVGLAQVWVSRDSFQEEGGSAALNAEAQDFDATFASLGARVAMPFSMADRPAVLRADAAWLHALDGDGAEERLAFGDGAHFTVEGVPLAEDTAELGASLEVGVSSNVSVNMGYSGRLGGELDDHGINATLNVRF